MFPLIFDENRKIGYISAGLDTVGETLQSLGMDVSFIDDDELRLRDLSVYDTIVVGMAGAVGALVSALGTVLPPLIIIAVISVGYEAFRDNFYVSRALKGMQAGVAAVIFSVVLRMAYDFVKARQWPSIVLMALALAASLCLSLNVIWILLFCGAAGIAGTLIDKAKGGKRT